MISSLKAKYVAIGSCVENHVKPSVQGLNVVTDGMTGRRLTADEGPNSHWARVQGLKSKPLNLKYKLGEKLALGKQASERVRCCRTLLDKSKYSGSSIKSCVIKQNYTTKAIVPELHNLFLCSTRVAARADAAAKARAAPAGSVTSEAKQDNIVWRSAR
ncbi:hypothetical protein EVAR_9122_1 [Eumeta japonica]|uniref:Uncharacterized protein n=1 Tax=Eumeta variegata TaxID=151549 RepID=A0A4C1TW76_EUMVA|nr:hypothetical protein EVAR_9122_1 [Eumeta japonica]